MTPEIEPIESYCVTADDWQSTEQEDNEELWNKFMDYSEDD